MIEKKEEKINFQKLSSSLSSLFTGREEEVRLILLSLIARHHTLLLGPPGTGKSEIISTISNIFNVPYFEYQGDKYTTKTELLGYINFKKLRETGIQEYVTTGKLPEASIAFIDEIFKLSSATRNTLLELLNKRKFYNGTTIQQTPLISCFGASNELPLDEEGSEAFYDRFLFRHWSYYLKEELWEEYLDKYWEIHKNKNILSKQDINIILQQDIFSVDWKPLRLDLLEVLKKLRSQKIEVSDRTKGRCLIAISANVLFHGRTSAEKRDLMVLKYVIPRTPEEVNVVHQVLIDLVGQEEKMIQELVDILSQVQEIRNNVKNTDDEEVIISQVSNLKKIKYKIDQNENSENPTINNIVSEIRNIFDEINDVMMEKVLL